MQIKKLDKIMADINPVGAPQRMMPRYDIDRETRDPNLTIPIPRGPITTPTKALAMFREFFRDVEVEGIAVMSLNSQLEFAGLKPAGMGDIDHVEFVTANILKAMFDSNGASFLVAHNHPSGNVTPSDEDLAALNELRYIGDRINRPMRDFLIIGFGPKGAEDEGRLRYYSHRDENYDL